MECPKCGSEKVGNHDLHYSKNKIRVKCRNCGETWSIPKTEEPVSGIGTPLDEWKDKYDVDHIVKKVMDNLDPNMMYEKSDIYKLSGLTASYPGLSAAIDSYSSHYGKAGGKQFFSHPDTINHYKSKGRLT